MSRGGLQSFQILPQPEGFRKADFAKWEEGYANTLNIYPLSITENKDKTVHVKLLSVDLVGEKFVTQYFEGDWEVKKGGDNLRLFDAKIDKGSKTRSVLAFIPHRLLTFAV